MTGALGLAVQAQATLYDISFTGTGITASGEVNVNASDIATSGFLVVDFNGVTVDYNALAPVGVTTGDTHGDNMFGQDNVFNPNSATQSGFTTVNGLIFYSGSSYSHAAGLIGLSDDGYGGPPNLFGLGSYGWGQPNVDGAVTASIAPVPEPTTILAGMAMLLPFGASAVRILRKRQTA